MPGLVRTHKVCDMALGPRHGSEDFLVRLSMAERSDRQSTLGLLRSETVKGLAAPQTANVRKSALRFRDRLRRLLSDSKALIPWLPGSPARGKINRKRGVIVNPFTAQPLLPSFPVRALALTQAYAKKVSCSDDQKRARDSGLLRPGLFGFSTRSQ
jgi:hypothetical protein